ncbi:HpcH/HpaI aldolase/citrate lyase family protein [Marinicauda sp. Alg238-R41]|uniref:HpcH/HpaI aldolase/citrate lyase family protein n=1 Tax=Marinicauda sp. Alg238-R41 TaxID=2993447 RepID=UPI0022E17D17|nr:CoA ester lyase [Marinicauda sp. Alg238-R41]
MTDETPVLKPHRSVLFVPADKPRAIEKACGLDADALILDLEDAVGEEGKAGAARSAPASIARWREAGKRALLRVNTINNAAFACDTAAAAEARPDAVVLPKVNRAETLLKARAGLQAAGYDGPVWAMIETPAALLNMRLIGETAQETRLEALLAGTNDLTAILRCKLDQERSAIQAHLTQIVLAARAYGLLAIDGVFNNFQDRAGFEFEARAGRTLGFDGKSLIHPSQIDAANRAFSPSAQEREWARRVVALFDEPENAGSGAIAMDGQMVERLHLDAARAILAAATEDTGETG